MIREFDTTDIATWPVVLTAMQISAIYQRPVSGVKKACQRGLFVPAPFTKQPYRWRRADVLRHIEDGRGFGGRLRRVG